MKQNIGEWEEQLSSIRTLILTKSEDVLSSTVPSKEDIQQLAPPSSIGIHLPSWQADPLIDVIKDIIK